jgi:hypothetical protein
MVFERYLDQLPLFNFSLKCAVTETARPIGGDLITLISFPDKQPVRNTIPVIFFFNRFKMCLDRSGVFFIDRRCN